jgi:DUF1680 family protein
LSLRVPAWCADARLTVNGAPVTTPAEEGYLRLGGTWQAGDRIELTLAMPAELVAAHPRVDAVRGAVALARGPLLYCLEQADLDAELADVVFEDLTLDATAPITVVEGKHPIAPVTLAATVQVPAAAGEHLYRPLATAVPPPRISGVMHAIPYHLWANRAPGPMRVWIPVAPQAQ